MVFSFPGLWFLCFLSVVSCVQSMVSLLFVCGLFVFSPLLSCELFVVNLFSLRVFLGFVRGFFLFFGEVSLFSVRA